MEKLFPGEGLTPRRVDISKTEQDRLATEIGGKIGGVGGCGGGGVLRRRREEWEYDER